MQHLTFFIGLWVEIEVNICQTGNDNDGYGRAYKASYTSFYKPYADDKGYDA